jgi:hypothetical protein
MAASKRMDMAYEITLEQIASITDEEVEFGTVRLLPEVVDIPAEFRAGNQYTELVEALFYGREIPQVDINLKPGITSQALNRCLSAHLKSWKPKQQHKVAGLGYMIFCASTDTAI